MRIIILLGIFIMSFKVSGEESFVILDAVMLPVEEQQPTWIALDKRGKSGYIHIPTGKTIHALEPGIYTIPHVDFGNNRLTGNGTIYLGNDRVFEFEVLSGTITFVGGIQIELERRRAEKEKYSISTKGTKLHLLSACVENKTVMNRLPVRIAEGNGKYKKVKVVCE